MIASHPKDMQFGQLLSLVCCLRNLKRRKLFALPSARALRRLSGKELTATSPNVSVVSLVALMAVLCGIQQCPAQDESAQYKEPTLAEFDYLHWAFQSVKPTAVPEPSFPDWRRNEIDDFVGAQLKQYGLKPQPAADRRTLIRRLSLDLVGLPPEPASVRQFMDAAPPDAYDQLVDAFLADEGYGERWAQHWLDLARFAETDGFEHDKTRADAWKYRDWVITAFNCNMPYDEFIRQQIAGDEFYPENESAVTATHFCLAGPDMPDINLIAERRHTLLNEMTSVVGEVILGLQLGCAQCHDHKYDPISQADFYRLRAVFEPALNLQQNKSVSVLKDAADHQAPSHLMLRGDFNRPGPEVQPDVLRVVSRKMERFNPVDSENGTGRRAALANWLVSAQNPLTARVIVNRVWQHHFGTGLVDSPSDFGLMGSEPSHYELLDWLSGWFVSHGWNLKGLHRLIVSSATWRQQSLLPADAADGDRVAWQHSLEADTDARLLSRYPRWRLEGEAIRDCMLAAAGVLDRRRGGPGIRPPLPKELVGTLLRNQWQVTEDESEHYRRSIYVFARRNLRYPIFEVFDRPSANSSCAARNVSTTAPQSLHLLNSEFALECARKLAARIENSSTDHSGQIDQAFLRILGRSPSTIEERDVVQFLDRHNSDASGKYSALTHLCLSLFNSNEFVFVD